jgi:ATP-dependent protease ClpP protease subunit
MSQRWYSFTQNDGVLDVFIANKISDSAQSIAPLLVAVEASNKIQITIDSLGGEGHAAWQLGSALAEKEASCLVIGNCQSAAVQIVVGCRPVRALETAVFMIHSPYIRLCGTLARRRTLFFGTPGGRGSFDR